MTNLETREREGFFVDIAAALAKKILGDPTKVTWSYANGVGQEGIVQFVVRGDVDVVIDAVGQAPFVVGLVNFSDEIFDGGSALLVRRDGPIKGLNDLKKGVKVVWDRSSSEVPELIKKYPDATYFPFADTFDEYQALRTGEVDVYTHYLPHLYSFASYDPNYVVVGRYTHKPYGIVSKKEDVAFKDYLNGFVKELKSSGEYDRLLTKWFSPYGDIRKL